MTVEHKGIVAAIHGKEILIEGTDGQRQRCIARQNIPPLVCGDQITWIGSTTGHGSIISLQPRHGELRAIAKDGKPRLVAANVDHVIIVIAAQPTLQQQLLDRYLIACEIAEIEPIIVFNKIDLLTADQLHEVQQQLSSYNKIGYQEYFVSASCNTGMNLLLDAIKHKMVVLVGQSGVGKSSLIRTLVPGSAARVGELSTQQGRHTTTHSELYHLPGGGKLIDSPGVRSFHLLPTDPATLAQAFVEFRPYLGQCRFADCQHLHEPDCAVRSALAQHHIEAARYEVYKELLAIKK